MGPELMTNMREQATRFGADIRTEKVTKVDLSARPFAVWVGDPDAPEPTYRGRTVIVSTGAQSLMLDLPRERDLIGHGLSTCATCDGFFFRDQELAVIGGGDSAVEEATFLTKFASKVTLIHRRDQLRASKIMQDRARANPKIDFIWDTVVEEYLYEDGPLGPKVTGLKLRSLETDEVRDMTVGGVFVAIGHRPNTDLFKGQLAMEDSGYLVTGASGTEMQSATDVDGVFACGDVQDHTYRQAITAAGSGCMAAIDAERWLEAHHVIDEQRTETDW
jgi:thioredoxin reductase (NADPH)